jgi:hypothetical protein
MPNKQMMTVVASTLFAAATTLASMPRAHAQATAPAAADDAPAAVAPAAAAPPAAAPAAVAPAPAAASAVAPSSVATPAVDAEVAKAAPAPASPSADATSADPNIDRGFLLPTAMTQPAGSVTYNNYELLLHGVSLGITDRVQASVTVLSPIVRDMPFVGFAAVKGRVVATDRFHLALQGSLGWGHMFDTSDSSADLYTLGAGAFASFCLRQDCSSLMSASATYTIAMPTDGTAAQMIIYSGSVVHRVGRHVKLLGEVGSAAGRVAGETENIDGVLVGYGLRFHTNDIAADVGFLKPFTGGADDGGFLVGLPFVNVSYRWQ